MSPGSALSPPDLPASPGLHRREDAHPPSRRWEVVAAVVGSLAVLAGVLMTAGVSQSEQRRETLIVRVVQACRSDSNTKDYLLDEACREANHQRVESGLTPAVPVPPLDSAPSTTPRTPAPEVVPIQRWSMTFRGESYTCTRTGGPNDRPTYSCIAERD